MTPREVVDFYHENIQKDFEKLLIRFDNYSRTSIPLHFEKAQEFFLEIYNKKKIKKKNQVWFDDEKEAKKKFKKHSCVK